MSSGPFESTSSWKSTDEHLILGVSLINGLRHRRHENLEATAEARHNRRQLARRLYHLRLYIIRRQRHLLVRAIDRAANELAFLLSINRSHSNYPQQLDDLTLK